MLNRLNKMILALVILLGVIPITPMKSAHAADYVVAPQLATGYYHSAVLISDGTVWAWGRNDKGQLSYDTGDYQAWPLLVRNLDHVKQIATGIMSNYAIKEDGTLWAWGLNENGQLGDGTLEKRTIPVQVKGISGVTAVSTGLGYHVLALKSDGTVWAWGRNGNGELGDGTMTQRQLPVQVTGLTDVVSLVNAGYHSLALKSDGTVWAWGRNSYGESGGGISADRTTPYQVSISGVRAIAAGDHHSIAVKEDGTVWTWGRNTYGTLGDGTTTSRVSPVQAIGIDHVKSVAGGTHFSYALKEDGTVWSWGANNYGQLGDGTTVTRLSPVQVSGLTGVVALGAGGYNGTAMQSGGEVWAWGYNGYGELGDKTRESRTVPVRNAAVLDVTPPTIVNPIITPTDITETGVTLSWQKATDNLRKQEELEYQVYQISSRTATTVSAVESSGTRIGTYEADKDFKQVTGLYDGQTYNFIVIVKDKDGRKSIYNKVSITTLAIPTFSVTYHTNGGTGSVPTDTNTYYQGELVTALGSGSLTRPGYTFAGWNTQADGNGTTYTVGARFNIGAENVELYAKWTQNPTYTVTYIVYGGTGSVPIDSNAYEQGMPVTVLGNMGNLAKPGYTFAGWSTQADGNGTMYMSGATFNIGAENVELYAKWTQNPTYTVTYIVYGGTGSVPIDSNAYEQGMPVTVLGNIGSLAKAGYIFAGWNTQADGNGTTYMAGATFNIGSENVEMYAKWTQNPTYTVTYIVYGGSGSTPIDSNAYEQGMLVTVLGNMRNLAKPGYTFAGWNTQKDGNGTAYLAGATFNIGAENVELYAKWIQNPTYKVTYIVYGGTGSVPIDSNAYEQGMLVTVLGNTGSLAKPGYTFAGWNTQEDGNGTTYMAGATFNIGAENMELYAKWTQNPTYTVTYNVYGGTGSVPIDSNAYEQGMLVTVLGNTGSLTRPGYTFAGWNTQEDGNGTTYMAGTTFNIGAENVELYAKWTQNPTYTVTYNVYGGTGSVPIDSNAYEQGMLVTVLGNMGSLEKPGYTFAGWNTQEDGNGTAYMAGTTFNIGAENVELYAKWTQSPTYTVTYIVYGGSGSVPIDSNAYEQGIMVTVLGNMGSLAKPGYTFAGWNTQKDGNGTAYMAGATFNIGAENVELYAKWTQNPTYTVTYNVYGGTGSVPIDSNAYEQGMLVTVLGNTGSLTRPGYTFAGWNTQADGNGTTYMAGATFNIGAENVELYAKWTQNPTYTVTYIVYGGSGSVPIDSNAYEQGMLVTVLGNMGNLAKPGYTFAGWDTQADGNGTAYAAGTKFNMGAENVELYAKWTQNPTNTVTYIVYGGTGSTPIDSNAYEQGMLVTVLGNTGSLARPGYTFAGWNTQADGNGTTYMAGATFNIGAVNVELYAKWLVESRDNTTDGGNSGTDSGTPSADGNTEKPVETYTGLRVTVDGQDQELVSDVSITKVDNQVKMILYMDTDKWKKQLEGEGERPEIVISVTQNVDKFSVVLTGDAVERIANKQGMLIVQTMNGNYKLPMGEIMLDAWTKPFGEQVSLADMDFQIDIAKSSADQIALLQQTATKEKVTVVGTPVNFTVTISYHGKRVEINKFNTYVERELLLPDGGSLNLITTAVRIDADGTIQHVPTRFTTQHGKTVAVVSSLTNSMYALIGNPIRFEDVESHWAKDVVNDLGSRMVVAGVDQNHFNPDASITRSEFAAILVRALGLADSMNSSHTFMDVKSDTWYNDSIAEALAYGLIEGYADGTFHPDRTITREEAITMIYRAMKLVGLDTNFSGPDIQKALSQFADSTSVHAWAEQAVVAAVTSGLIQGSRSELMLERDITRAETTAIVYRMLVKANLIDRVNDEANHK